MLNIRCRETIVSVQIVRPSRLIHLAFNKVPLAVNYTTVLLLYNTHHTPFCIVQLGGESCLGSGMFGIQLSIWSAQQSNC